MTAMDEEFAEEHADQHLGCVKCRKSHHVTGFCSCGQCWLCLIGTKRVHHDGEVGTIVHCTCGKNCLWD